MIKSTLIKFTLTVTLILNLSTATAQNLIRERIGKALREKIGHTHHATQKTIFDSGESETFGGVKSTIWRPTNGSNWPLVIFSHGFHGCSTQSKFLTVRLAQEGYLVVAPNHADAFCGQISKEQLKPDPKFKDAAAWNESSYKNRATDIKNVIDALKKDPKWVGKIDWGNVALAGHSLGGYTVLGLAGAWASWKLTGIKAVLALSPYCQPFVEQKTLSGITMPVMYQGGTLDIGITPTVKKTDGAYDQTPKAYFIEFKNAGHFAWTDLKEEFHKEINNYAIEFMNKYLKNAQSKLLEPKSSDDPQILSLSYLIRIKH
jgi:predicted dienelactone hydrolase